MNSNDKFHKFNFKNFEQYNFMEYLLDKQLNLVLKGFLHKKL